MKRKFSSIWRVGVVLALVASLGMVFAPPVAANGVPELKINVEPGVGTTLFCGETKTLTVTVSNSGDYAEDVVLTGKVAAEDPGTLTPDIPVLLYDICPDGSKETTFELTCTGPDGVDVTFTATPTNGRPSVLEVAYENICRFDVDITMPDDGDIVAISDTFGVAANITNNTAWDCDSVTVTLGIVGTATLEGGSLFYTITIPAGETEEVNWTVHCESAGEVVLTVTAVGCGQEEPCATLCADSIKIFQTPPGGCTPNCSFTYEILDPEPRCDEDICVCSTFPVKVKVTNTGNACGGTISGTVEMRPTDIVNMFVHEPGQPESDKSIQVPFSGIAPGESQTLTFTWHCYDANDNCDTQWQSAVSFEAHAWGHCEGGVWMPIGTQSWSNYVLPADIYNNYINQTWLDLKFVDSAGNPICTCRDYCVNDDILMYPKVKNCGDATLKNVEVYFMSMSGNINWVGPAKTHIFMGDIPAGGEVTSGEAFHFVCTGAGEVYLTFKGTGVYEPVETVCDIDVINLHQKSEPGLEVVLTAPDCQQYCDEFDVTAKVTNTGSVDASPIENVVVDLYADGDVELVTPMEFVGGDTNGDGKLDYGETWEYKWGYHCNGPDDAYFDVDVDGVASCGGTLSDGDDEYVEQIKLDVDIISPDPCDTKCVSETFCVTAEITDNDDDTCFDDPLTATISFPSGKADIEAGEVYAKTFALTDGDIQQISWSVHCKEPGDTDIKVEVTGTASDSTETGTCANCTLVDKFDTITIHQIAVPDLAMEIVSPDNLDTLVATSQDFAVTAVIVNNTELGDVTVTDVGLMYHPESGATILEAPEAGFVIPEGESQIVTWTMHCEEPGLEVIIAYATAENEVGCVGEAWTFPLLLWQYPAAHLEVEILEVVPDTTIVVCEDFTVKYKVYNTGAADATEVEAILSVIPEGSARPVEGLDSGYTQYIGTIPRGGETGVLTWDLHCKEACESNIVITAEGNDEYGWHKKQECQSTGNFIVEAGCFALEPMGVLGGYLDNNPMEGISAGKFGVLFGESSGMIGPFIIHSDVQVHVEGGFTVLPGELDIMGVVIPDMPPSHYQAMLEFLCGRSTEDGSCDLLALLEQLNMQGVNKDVMLYIGTLRGPGLSEVCGSVAGGLFTIINGRIIGGELDLLDGEVPTVVVLSDGEYCSTMAKEALRPIVPEFIESDTVTVKQIMPAQLVVDISYPPDGERYDATQEFKVTAIISNIGDETADGVIATLTVDEFATITDPTKLPIDIAGGDSVSVSWDVECDDSGFSVFTATATGTGELTGNTTDAFDTVTVEQGEVPLAQLVVDISYPGNGEVFIEGDEFPVTAWIKNVGEMTAEAVAVSIDISDNAIVVDEPDGWPKAIRPTSEAVATWMVECTSAGFSVIVVTAEGDSTNNACNTAVDVVTIKQIAPPKPYLTVDVSAPGQILEGEDFTVTAVVSNIGTADAEDVNVDMTASGLVTPLSDDWFIGAIDAGDSVPFEFDFTCEGEGGVNISVEAYGTDTNTAADSVAVQQINVPEDTTAPVVTVYVPNGGESWQGGTLQAITWSATDDVTPQANLAIAITYSVNGGGSWSTVVASTGNDGAYKWTVPTINSKQCLVKVTATDAALNAAFDISDDEFTIYTPPEWVEEYDIGLNAGWNLISLPLIPFDMDIDDVLDGISVAGSVDIVWAYDADTETWGFYDPDFDVGDLAEMKDGVGYWLNMKVPAILTIYGTPMPAPGPNPPPAYDVYEGWNLMGFKSLGAMANDTYLINIVGDYTIIWGYDELDWFLVFPTPPGVGELQTGLGYWLWMTTDGVIIPPGL